MTATLLREKTTDMPESIRPVPVILHDTGSRDTNLRHAPEMRVDCPGCDALTFERCATERYPSGRPMRFAAGFCPERTAAAAARAVQIAHLPRPAAGGDLAAFLRLSQS